MKLRAAILGAAAVGALAAVPPITDPDDGADVREEGSVVVIGPPPAGGGGSVSAVGTGCTTRGATTKLPSANVLVDVDAGSIELPAIPAGVVRIVVRNFDSEPHGLVLTELESPDDLTIGDDGLVDEEALPNKLFRIAEFPGNTICEGAFELPPGHYVVFSPAPGDVDAGIVAELTICDSMAPFADSTMPDSTAPPTSAPPGCEPVPATTEPAALST
ncbi:MAG: hypothetical protein ACRD0G_19310 [Acidimicrobiales bacterium]